MFVLVAKKLAYARLRDMLHQKLRTMMLGVATLIPKVARNDASCVCAFKQKIAQNDLQKLGKVAKTQQTHNR